jgi:hypothetical protein
VYGAGIGEQCVHQGNFRVFGVPSTAEVTAEATSEATVVE